MSFTILTYGNPDADTLLLQMTDDHDLEVIEKEIAYIRELSGGQDFCLKAVKIHDWNKDLSPWPAPAVFGRQDFGDGAAETLRFVREEVLDGDGPEVVSEVVPSCTDSNDRPSQKRIFLGGYSLAGLFALWAGFQTDRFDGIAAASPSVWFPGFTEYMKKKPIRTEAVYLSLGDREERTRNQVMARVGQAIREAEVILKEAGKDCVLEWNRGNHFAEPDLRTAKAFAWLMNREQ